MFYSALLKETIQERPQYTWQEIFAFVGGTFGLMTGMSLISFMEVGYVVFVYLCELIYRLFKCFSRFGT